VRRLLHGDDDTCLPMTCASAVANMSDPGVCDVVIMPGANHGLHGGVHIAKDWIIKRMRSETTTKENVKSKSPTVNVGPGIRSAPSE